MPCWWLARWWYRRTTPGTEPTAPIPVGARREIDRVRNISTRMVPGDPAQALLDAAESDRVGNRGLGAQEGHELGSVPAEIVRRANTDVLIVQVPEEAESEFT
jgi:nucleotide-binding universal stress UspA family protein